MKAKHTPGPWIWVQPLREKSYREGHPDVTASQFLLSVAEAWAPVGRTNSRNGWTQTVLTSECCGDIIGIVPNRHDRALIAVAPDLLAACVERLALDDQDNQGTEEWCLAVSHANAAMRRAIAKATGG